MAKIIPLKERKMTDSLAVGGFSTPRDYYHFIPGACGKKLNGFEQMLCQILIEFTSENQVAYLDYDWLKGKLRKSKKTIYRMLNKLKLVFNVSVIRGKRPINGKYEQNKLEITRSDDFNEIISNAISHLKDESSSVQKCTQPAKNQAQVEFKNVSSSVQKCPELSTKVSTIYISNKKNINENKDISCLKTCAREEEEPMETKLTDEIFLFREKQEYLSTEKKHEHISDAYESLKEQEYANREYVDDSEEEQAEIDASETGIKEVESEKRLPKYALAKDCELELNYELSKAFDLETYSKTIKQITFSYDKTNHKLTLIHEGPLTLSANQKECIKTISAKVYGEGVAISSRARVKNEKFGTQSQSSIINDSGIEMWERVKKAVLLAKGEAYVRSWLYPLAAKLDEENKKLVISGPIFFLSFIQRELEPVLEAVMKNEGYSCDLLGYERGEEKLVASVPFVKFFPKEGAGASDISVNLKRW